MNEPKLTDIARPIFLFASTFGERIDRGEKPSSEQLMSELKQIVNNMDTAARSMASLQARYTKLRFGLIGLADEIVFNSKWDGHQEWQGLEKVLCDTQIAGSQVYEIIEHLTPADADLAEGYFFVLSLGFRGSYLMEEGKWASTLKQLYDMIPKPHGLNDFRLTPEAYKAIPKKSTRLDPLFSLWRSVILFVICLVSVFVFYQAVWIAVVADARDAATTVTERISNQKLRIAYEAVKTGKDGEAKP